MEEDKDPALYSTLYSEENMRDDDKFWEALLKWEAAQFFLIMGYEMPRNVDQINQVEQRQSER